MEGYDEELYDDATAVTEDPEVPQETGSNTSPPVPETTATVSVKDRLKMFNTNNNSSGFPVGPKPTLPKKAVVTARPAQSTQNDVMTKSELNSTAITQNSEQIAKRPKPIPTGAKPIIPTGAKPMIPTGAKPIIPTGAKPTSTTSKPTSPASKPFFKKPQLNANSTNLVSELKFRQTSFKSSLCQSDSGETFRKVYFVAEHESDKPEKPKSLNIEDVDLPAYTYSTSCNGCNDENPVPIRTNLARQTNDESHQLEDISEKIKSLTEEEELAMDGKGGGSGGSRIPGGDTDDPDWYDDANPGQQIEEEYDTCDIDSPTPDNSNQLQNGSVGGSTASLSVKEQSKIEREKSKKDLKNQKKLLERQKKIQKQQEELCKKYKLSDEEINSNEIVRCAELISEGKNLPFGLNQKQAVFLVREIEKNKWIIKNQDGKLGVVDASKMEQPEVHEQIQEDYEQEDVYEEV